MCNHTSVYITAICVFIECLQNFVQMHLSITFDNQVEVHLNPINLIELSLHRIRCLVSIINYCHDCSNQKNKLYHVEYITFCDVTFEFVVLNKVKFCDT